MMKGTSYTVIYSFSNVYRPRTSDGGNRSHNVSLPIIFFLNKVSQILQYSCISLLLAPIILYWIQVSVSISVLLYFGLNLYFICIRTKQYNNQEYKHYTNGIQKEVK